MYIDKLLFDESKLHLQSPALNFESVVLQYRSEFKGNILNRKVFVLQINAM